MRYHIITFGCQMNKSDSERIATVFQSMGYKQASKENEADLIVVNMCSVRQSAVDRVYGLLPKFKELKAKNPHIKTVLTGCILKSDQRKFSKAFDYILNIKNLPKWPKFFRIMNYESGIKNYLNIQPKYQANSSAFVPISTGCNNFCSYCVVPYARGPLTCRSHQDILKEVKDLIKNGFKEIWLLGQNVNNYISKQRTVNNEQKMKPPQPEGWGFSSFSDKTPHRPALLVKGGTGAWVNFPKLLRMVNNIPGNFWIRFISPHPMDFSDELIDTLAECKKVAPYLNLPVQSGDNDILKKMNRSYNVLQYKKLVRKIREKIPDINLSTDVIVGFPGETKKQFQNTVKLFKEIKFDMIYIAKYSPRPGTAAFKMEDNVPQKEKKRREKVLREILNHE